MHHADAQSHSFVRFRNLIFFSVDEDLACIGLLQTEQNVHQRGLAGSIFAEKTVYRSSLQDKRNIPIRYGGTEGFCDIFQPNRHTGILLHGYAFSW